MTRDVQVGVAGNPNAGKTSVFNHITGAMQTTGNWAGVTVSKVSGKCNVSGTKMNIVDLPGTYSLSAHSEDELVARNYIVKEQPDVVINVVDATALEHNLFMTLQLVELGVPMVIALNMYDQAEKRDLKVDASRLSKILGVPVVPTVGTSGKGIKKLMQEVLKVVKSHKRSSFLVDYGPEIEHSTQKIQEVLSETEIAKTKYPPHFFAHKLLEGDKKIEEEVETIEHPEIVHNIVESEINRLKKLFGDDVETLVIDRRYEQARIISKEVIKGIERRQRFVDRIDRFLANRFIGLPFFGILMYGIFYATFTWGAPISDWLAEGLGWIDSVLFASLTGSSSTLISNIGNFLSGVINDGIGGILVFFPFIIILFLFLSFMEDSGYMARIAYIMDGIMSKIGLSGKAFIPYVVSMGCTVPGVMATRTLDSKRERILTILTTPLVACVTRMEVFFFLAAIFFAGSAIMQSMVVWSVFIFGILLAVILVAVFSKIFFKNEPATPLLIELPPYRWPTVRSVLIHTWDRTKHFLQKAGGIILIGAVVFWILSNTPSGGVASNGNLSMWIAIISALVLWMIANTVFAKSLYQNPASRPKIVKTINLISFVAIVGIFVFGIMPHISLSVEVIEQSVIGSIGHSLEWMVKPLGLDWRAVIALLTGFIAKELLISVFATLGNFGEDGVGSSVIATWYNTPAILGLMVFFNLYAPCLATIGAIKSEAGWKWMWFSVVYGIALGWIMAFIVYRIGMLFY